MYIFGYIRQKWHRTHFCFAKQFGRLSGFGATSSEYTQIYSENFRIFLERILPEYLPEHPKYLGEVRRNSTESTQIVPNMSVTFRKFGKIRHVWELRDVGQLSNFVPKSLTNQIFHIRTNRNEGFLAGPCSLYI